MFDNRLKTILATALIVLALPSAGAADIAWDKAIGVSGIRLSAAQRTRAEGLLRRIENTRGCEGTLAECLARGDRTARRHAGYVMRSVRRERPDETIIEGVADRAASAFPGEIHKPDLGSHPRVGPADAPVRIVEYACFQCPFCAHLAAVLEQRLKKEFGDKVVHYYKFFPVRSSSRGVESATAGVAAHRQGRFWQMYSLMFANRTRLGDDDLLRYASRAGLDVERFQRDLKDPEIMRLIERDKLEGMRFGVRGTPTFLINGKLYRGHNDLEELIDRIGEEIDIVEGRIK